MAIEVRLDQVTPEQLRTAGDFAVIDTDDSQQFELFCFRPAPLTSPGFPARTLPRLFEVTMQFSDLSQWNDLTRLLCDAGKLHEGSQALIDRAIRKHVRVAA